MLINSITFQNKEDVFPKSLSFFGHTLDLSYAVTFIVGDNGSGKTTFIELMALKLGLIRIYQPQHAYDVLEASLEKALGSFQIRYLTKPKGVFFGAEDFTSYIHLLEQEKTLAKRELEAIEKAYEHKSVFAKNQARMPHARTIYEIDQLHEGDLLKESHGEAYLDFFKSRIRDNHLYLLDEPETPLSIQNQLSLMLIIKDAVSRGCQFVIATHSPILTAYPNAHIYELIEGDIRVSSYETLGFVQTMKDFLNHKDQFIYQLFKHDDSSQE